MQPQHRAADSRDRPDLRLRSAYFLWASVLLYRATAGMRPAEFATARWTPSASTGEPDFVSADALIHTLDRSGVIAHVVAAGAAINLLVALLGLFNARLLERTVCWAFAAALPAAAGSTAVWLCLPWEDPYTGDGSRMAVQLGILANALIAAVLAAPGLWLCYRLSTWRWFWPAFRAEWSSQRTERV